MADTWTSSNTPLDSPVTSADAGQNDLMCAHNEIIILYYKKLSKVIMLVKTFDYATFVLNIGVLKLDNNLVFYSHLNNIFIYFFSKNKFCINNSFS